ncbi:hypothetical protein EW145_g1307 [Phellinidium pouzarii]|uniref:Uncharacterized protein n=1 Tax=Phellinidium pouzarii TaxID=167371 RepID=A0A4S4LFL6_9AGAM|nr:hypothetical protein EW145_g1307 [Phellinidium pouzarii]
MLPGSPTLHDSSTCGLPVLPLSVFIDDAALPTFTYDPGNIPVNTKTNLRSIVQAQIQFDSDHVLDVHNTRLYPFDTYLVSTSIRVTSSNSTTKDVPASLTGLPVLKVTSSFSITSRDTAIVVVVNREEAPARHLELSIRRPGDARAYAMTLFGINWILCHCCIGIGVLSFVQGKQMEKYTGSDVFVQQKTKGSKDVLKQLAGVLAVLLVIPQLRGAMPDAPGFDGESPRSIPSQLF